MVAILVYLQFSDRYAGIWSMSAAIISLIGKTIQFQSLSFQCNPVLPAFSKTKTFVSFQFISSINCLIEISISLISPLLNSYINSLLLLIVRRLHSFPLFFQCTRMESKLWSSSSSHYHTYRSGSIYYIQLHKRFSRH
jgi:hypothetical protein